MSQQSLPYAQGPAHPNVAGGPARKGRAFSASAGLALSLGLVLLAWKGLILLRGYPAFILPAPELVARRLIDEFAGGTLPYHAGITIVESLAGFGLALSASL